MVKCDEQKQALLESLDETYFQLLNTAESFSDYSINKIPFKGSWTAAQVLDHITRSNTSITKALHLNGTMINRDPGDRVDELKEIFLDFTTKLKSPSFILPTQDIYEKETVMAWLKESIGRLKEIQEQVDLSEMINHPAFGDITKFEILHFVLYHTQRHINQLKQIFAAITDSDKE